MCAGSLQCAVRVMDKQVRGIYLLLADCKHEVYMTTNRSWSQPSYNDRYWVYIGPAGIGSGHLKDTEAFTLRPVGNS